MTMDLDFLASLVWKCLCMRQTVTTLELEINKTKFSPFLLLMSYVNKDAITNFLIVWVAEYHVR